MYKTVYTEVEVDIDLDDFETDDLIEELKSRGHMVTDHNDGTTHNELLTKIWELRRLGKDYEAELDELLYKVLGKVI